MPDYRTQKRYWEGIEQRRAPNHPVIRAFCEPKIALVRREIGQQGSLLEVGAGNGYFTLELLKYFDLTAVDFSINMLRMNPAPPGRRIQGDAESLPFSDDSFDVVLCGNLLHHLASPLAAVMEMARVARDHVVLIEPNALNPAMFLFGLLKKEERGSLKFMPWFLRELGKASGISLRRFVTHGSVLPNKTPQILLPLLRRLDSAQPFAFYNIAVFDVGH